ncbi:hypothetical protein [Candidatus Magnetaquicoccus inordinatus]|uniref:siroheme decarboxylase subunit beta n=1 Tax=Candidatus Magnetaquicoccus inordinatus TaxID=2496818 RepID=UPI001D0E5DFB|nr:hypothetical protein [Candidatus Magnetaquicoccus inordinatus]
MSAFMLGPYEERLLMEIQKGLPLVSRPFQQVGERLGLTEEEVLHLLTQLQQRGIIKRMGVIVRHHELGYRANAMVVWDLPDELVEDFGQKLIQHGMITLCYQRARVLPHWPYNLYCMIHGKAQQEVLQAVHAVIHCCEIGRFPHQVLFSVRRFKQRGAYYFAEPLSEWNNSYVDLRSE